MIKTIENPIVNNIVGAKLTFFLSTNSLNELPELNKGKGVILQRYKDGTLSDLTTFKSEDGLKWEMNGGRQRTEKDILTWHGKRGGAGKVVPIGFPRPPVFK